MNLSYGVLAHVYEVIMRLTKSYRQSKKGESEWEKEMTLKARRAEHALTHTLTQFKSNLTFPFFSCFTHTHSNTRALTVSFCCIQRDRRRPCLTAGHIFNDVTTRLWTIFGVKSHRERKNKRTRAEASESAQIHTHTSAKLLRDAYCRPKHTDVDYAIKSISRSRSFALLRFIFTPLQWTSVCMYVC